MDARRLWLSLLACASLFPNSLLADSLPLAVHRGESTFTLRAELAHQSWWLVVGAAAPSAKPFPITVRCETSDAEEHLPRCEEDGPSSAWRALRREQLARWQAAARVEDDAVSTRRESVGTRGFWMLQRDRDLEDPSSYVHAKADLVATGRECIVYLDREETNDERAKSLAQATVRVFDDEVAPWMEKHLGRAEDVDRDGRFCIFLTPRVAKMQGTAGSLQGFVRGSDFHRDLDAPFGNRCDMMYLSSKVVDGPTLKALLAHEYGHAVVFAERVLRPRLPNAERKDEESWLSEGLSHLIERALVPDSPHLDHRLSAYLNDPARHRLVASDYFADKLWRDPGTRGAAIRFLEWCQEREPDLIRRLGRTSHRGLDNLEIAMQKPFAELFRQWAVSQIADSAPGGSPIAGASVIAPLPLRERGGGEGWQNPTAVNKDLRKQFSAPWMLAPLTPVPSPSRGEGRPRLHEVDAIPASLLRYASAQSPFLLIGPRPLEGALADMRKDLDLAGAGVAYLRLKADRPGAHSVTVRGPANADLQVTLVPIAADAPSLDLVARRDGDRLTVSVARQRDDVEILDASIEWLNPGPRLYLEAPIRRLNPHQMARPFELDPAWRTQNLVVKVVGMDRQQRPAVGWILVPAPK